MDKTIHTKLTEKQLLCYTPTAFMSGDDMFATFRQERRILDTLSKDLLQPRPEAVANILELARKL